MGHHNQYKLRQERVQKCPEGKLNQRGNKDTNQLLTYDKVWRETSLFTSITRPDHEVTEPKTRN